MPHMLIKTHQDVRKLLMPYTEINDLLCVVGWLVDR